jgi:galacturonosyltransferase
MKKILISANDAFVIFNFREGLIRELINRGYEVVCTAEEDDYVKDIEALGASFISFDIDKKGRNPLKEIETINKYKKQYKKINPDLILQFTIKPNLYGTLAARSLNIPVINNITGLGIAFQGQSLSRKIVEFLYKRTLKYPKVTFFQNKDDLSLFQESKLLKTDNYDLLPGSGVDVNKFTPFDLSKKKTVDFLFVGRMIKEKGLELYMEVAKNIKSEYDNVNFHVCGSIPKDSNLDFNMFSEYKALGYIINHGVVKNIRELHAFTDCLVLPTYYREGVPRSLIEAASSAIPIITTNNVGCKDIVEDGYNGYLVEKNDYDSLYLAVKKFLDSSKEVRTMLGKSGRQKVLDEFDEEIVINKYLEYINE